MLEMQDGFLKVKSSENISIGLSFLGLLEYFLDKSKYFVALNLLNDGKYLANYTQNASSKLFNEFCFAEVYLAEKNYELALLHFKNAKDYALKNDEYALLTIINTNITAIQAQFSTTLPQKRDPLIALLKIGQAVSAQTDIDTLLNVIAEETKSALLADRCSVFLFDKEKNEIWSKVALGLDHKEIRFSADKGLAGHVVKTGERINIQEAYEDERFNKDIDVETGYRTKTILCMPIKNLNQEIIGAFQVLNKNEGTFSDKDEELLLAIGSSAGIAIENAQLFQKQKEMFIEQKQTFDSFIDTLATSIDARDKITAGHTSRVRMYAKLLSQAFNLDDRMIEIIEKAATLHDIGKIGIRDSVLQKEGKLTDEEYKHIQEHVEITHHILDKIHTSVDFKLITEIACSHHEKYDGSGYYKKLKGEEIPFGGRILAVSDVFDAITSKRHYRDKMPIDKVIDILIKDSGTHFDKTVVDCFLGLSCDKIIKVFLTENHMHLEKEHQDILAKYSVQDLHNMLKSESNSSEHLDFMGLFKKYYTATKD